MIKNAAPKYSYPLSLASTISESSLHQHFLKDHFTSITDCKNDVLTSEYFITLVLNTLKI